MSDEQRLWGMQEALPYWAPASVPTATGRARAACLPLTQRRPLYEVSPPARRRSRKRTGSVILSLPTGRRR